MQADTPLITREIVIRDLIYTAVFNTGIAVVLWLLFLGNTFLVYLIISQLIGLSICAFALTGHYWFKPVRFVSRIGVTFLAVILGTVIGGMLGLTFTQTNPYEVLRAGNYLARMILVSLIAGSVVGYYFVSSKQITDTEKAIQAERIKRLTLEKQAAETRMKLLQAQIEPHFLFNTLSNIYSLIDSDVEKSKRMLTDLIDYLRNSLDESRKEKTTLGKEIDIIKSYLNLFQVRFGSRLSFSIHLASELASVAIAPMLIQPIVENAILHGISPLVEGGEIAIVVEKVDRYLEIVVSDTGKGFQAGDPPGVGLRIVRERLHGLYGKEARVLIHENSPKGVRISIKIPYDLLTQA